MSVKKSTIDRAPYIWALTRISLGFIFLWAFFDKLFGLGFATCRDLQTDTINVMCEKAWAAGGSPTLGFLKFGTQGPLAEFFQSLAGNTFVDWLFMVGLLGIGMALTFGIAIRLAAITGSIMLLLMWLAALWPANNPVIDDHIIYILVLIGLLTSDGNQVWGVKGWWIKQPIAKRFPILR